jgi:hypothetical protein
MSNVMDPSMPASAVPVQVTAQQLATILVYEMQVRSLETGANALMGMLSLKTEADVLISARDHIVKALNKMKSEWDRKIIVASPADVPRLVAP